MLKFLSIIIRAPVKNNHASVNKNHTHALSSFMTHLRGKFDKTNNFIN